MSLISGGRKRSPEEPTMTEKGDAKDLGVGVLSFSEPQNSFGTKG